MVVIIGLTSSIGCGKTTVANVFKELGTRILDVDKIARNILIKNKKVRHQVLKELGTTSPEKLSEKVFSSKPALEKLNSITHPLVFSELKKIIANHRKKQELLVVDIPLLYETRCAHLFDAVLVVKCSKEKQLERLLKRGMSKADAVKRINSQIPLIKKLEKADIVIDNNGTIESTSKQVILINNFLKALNK